MQSKAQTVDGYLSELDPLRRKAIEAVRNIILKNLPPGYEEAMNWGMICYQVPLSICPDTYNGQPLMLAALASQKNHMAVYLTAIYMDQESRKEFESAYRATGKPMDTGKSCVRFRTLENLPLELIANVIARYDVTSFVARVQRIQGLRKNRK